MPRLSATFVRRVMPGAAVAVLVAIAAQFLSEHYAVPAMLMALLLGLALGFVGEEARTAPGVIFTAQWVLRAGVALLGARISIDLLLALGPGPIALVVAGAVATLLAGLAAAQVFGFDWRFGFLTAGAVAICGASAAMAIAAILPRNEGAEQRLTFTVLGVTVLSTVAMIAYPVVIRFMELDAQAGGVFLGGTIHDVAQVVGAGFSVSDGTGDTATLVKLIRVTMLAPVVLIASFLLRRGVEAGRQPPLVPGFVLVFLALATTKSAGLLPGWLAELASATSRWALLVAIAAVGMKTSLRRVLDVGGGAIALLVGETLFIAGFILVGLALLS